MSDNRLQTEALLAALDVLVARWCKEADCYAPKEWIRVGYLRCADELEHVVKEFRDAQVQDTTIVRPGPPELQE